MPLIRKVEPEPVEVPDEVPEVLGAEEATKQQMSVVPGLDDLTAASNVLHLPVSMHDNSLDTVQLQISGSYLTAGNNNLYNLV